MKSISHNYAKIKVDSYNSLALEKSMTFHNVIILIKSVRNKDKNNYYCNAWNECHNLLMMSMDLIDIAISNIRNADYRCIISAISKSEAINLMQNTDSTRKRGTL